MKKLQHSFLKVETHRENAYGGNQAWFRHKFLKKYGCGVIGAADVLLCLQGKEQLSEAEFMDFAHDLWKHYLPVIPGSGMTGLTLVHGMNRYFRKNRMGYRACWKFSEKKMMSRIETMLAEGIPVILSIGPNFPFFWEKHNLPLYKKNVKEELIPAAKAKAHYVVVTGMSDELMQISSWGRKYYIVKSEYNSYVKKHSSSLVSNIVCIRKIKELE